MDIRLREVGAKRPLKKTENRRRSRKKSEKKWRNFFFLWRDFQQFSIKNCSYLRPLLSITFPQGFRIFKNIGHPTLGKGGKKTFKRYLKSEQTDKQTDKQTHRQTYRRTNRLIESIGPEGRCFEKKDLGENEQWLNEWINQSIIDNAVCRTATTTQLHNYTGFIQEIVFYWWIYFHTLYLFLAALIELLKILTWFFIYDYLGYLSLGLTKPGKLPSNFCNKTYMYISISIAKDNIDRDPLFCLKFYWQTESDIVQLAYVYGLNRVYYLELYQTKGIREGHSGQEQASNKYVNK